MEWDYVGHVSIFLTVFLAPPTEEVLIVYHITLMFSSLSMLHICRWLNIKNHGFPLAVALLSFILVSKNQIHCFESVFSVWSGLNLKWKAILKTWLHQFRSVQFGKLFRKRTKVLWTNWEVWTKWSRVWQFFQEKVTTSH